ncbi:MAG: RsmB/NOP family class I SAM-dependent RNA methyltransferase [Firmicutes bacterium]|nr:RsmB/NOP family class I SAM-dependent RNA methyltransferase [Bacillota bacterium]
MLPLEFENRMKNMLGSEYADFAYAIENGAVYSGIRINPLKKNSYEIVTELTGKLERIKWCENGYYIDKSVLSGKHPYHMGGLVYFQEPSAMSTVEALGIENGDFVLDLCAAPGGKATHAAEKLGGTGLLVANEIIPKRAAVLAENIQRMGIKNAVVTNESPERLAQKYGGFFDKIIVDAPCSGEGMFKKEPKAIEEWSETHTSSCAVRQKHILDSALRMLRGGGKLVYSTCTFAPCENEGVVDYILKKYPYMRLLPIELDGVSDGNGKWCESEFDLSMTKRIFPHRSKGEGHFIALFEKTGGQKNICKKHYDCQNEDIFRQFEHESLNTHLHGEIVGFGDRLYLIPYELDVDKIKVVLPGLMLGTCKKGRFEPAHSLCVALESSDFKITEDTREPEKFYRGETLASDKKGWCAVLYNNCPIGWGKASDGVLKNHFPKYLRQI